MSNIVGYKANLEYVVALHSCLAEECMFYRQYYICCAWFSFIYDLQEKQYFSQKYSIVKDSNADLTIGNWESKIDP